MSNGEAVISAILLVALVIFGVASCSSQWAACEAAGGHPVYEYKNLPSCWDKDGRRIFP